MIISALACFIVGFVLSAGVIFYVSIPDSYVIPDTEALNGTVLSGDLDVSVVKEQDLSIHFLELGNKYTGDCTLIKVGETEILIDAGSRASSVPTIQNYLQQYVDGPIEYVIVTHAHQDHYAGFATSKNQDSLFDLFEVETVIEFARTNQKETGTMYQNYQREKQELIERCGTNVYTALECVNSSKDGAKPEYILGDNIKLQILYQKYYEQTSSTENNYSVCCQIVYNDNYYLFTGDLEEDGEKSLVEKNADKLHPVEVYKAGHHGSKTSSSATLLAKIQPKVVCVCCCAGSSEYTTKNENQFPTQDFIDRVAPHTSQIYVTTLCIDYKAGTFEPMNGNIVIYYRDNKRSIHCANNTTRLQDTDWFKNNRKLPANAAA